jgi:phage shock protein A
VGRVIAGGAHARLDTLEDMNPLAVMEQALREADGVIDEVRHELGTVSANRHLAQQQHARLNRSHEALREQVAQALAAQREDLARAAVARQLDIEAQIPVLETTLADLARQEQQLQGFTTALLARKREMQEALAAYRGSRAAAASSAQPVGQSNVEQRLGKVSDAFDRVFQRQTGLDGTQRAAGVDQSARLAELEQLVRDHKIAERLAQLKAGQA